MRFAVPSACFLIAASALAQAQTAVQSPGTQAQPEEIVVTGEIPDANKRVCKRSVATGSIMPKRVCKTKGEWEEIRVRSIAAVERMKAEGRARDHVRATRENGGS